MLIVHFDNGQKAEVRTAVKVESGKYLNSNSGNAVIVALDKDGNRVGEFPTQHVVGWSLEPEPEQGIRTRPLA
jgi:hypothetical protein